MLRTVPETINEEVDLYIRTYYSLLRSSQAIRVRSLEDTHAGTHASLHPKADDPEPDVSTLVYAATRLPTCIYKVKLVLLGQSDEVFLRRAGVDISDWHRVFAMARRRKMFFDGKDTLAAYIGSVSDIDDLIPILTAYQIEWNKLHQRFQPTEIAGWLRDQTKKKSLSEPKLRKIRSALQLSEDDFNLLRRTWHGELFGALRTLATEGADLSLNLLAGSVADYRQAVQAWWKSVAQRSGLGALGERSIYFVSSNPHSLPNLLNGYARQHRTEVLAFLQEHNPENLWPEWQKLEQEGNVAGCENMLYYLQRSYLQAEARRPQEYFEHERLLGHPPRRQSPLPRRQRPGDQDLSTGPCAFRPALADAGPGAAAEQRGADPQHRLPARHDRLSRLFSDHGRRARHPGRVHPGQSGHAQRPGGRCHDPQRRLR